MVFIISLREEIINENTIWIYMKGNDYKYLTSIIRDICKRNNHTKHSKAQLTSLTLSDHEFKVTEMPGAPGE